MITADKAKEIVDAIILDICDRRGLWQAWEEIDEDIQNEIRHEWEEMITAICL